jgi:hypothetical protein
MLPLSGSPGRGIGCGGGHRAETAAALHPACETMTAAGRLSAIEGAWQGGMRNPDGKTAVVQYGGRGPGWMTGVRGRVDGGVDRIAAISGCISVG